MKRLARMRCLDLAPHEAHAWPPLTPRNQCPGRKVSAQVRLAAWRQFRVDLETLDLELGR